MSCPHVRSSGTQWGACEFGTWLSDLRVRGGKRLIVPIRSPSTESEKTADVRVLVDA